MSRVDAWKRPIDIEKDFLGSNEKPSLWGKKDVQPGDVREGYVRDTDFLATIAGLA